MCRQDASCTAQQPYHTDLKGNTKRTSLWIQLTTWIRFIRDCAHSHIRGRAVWQGMWFTGQVDSSARGTGRHSGSVVGTLKLLDTLEPRLFSNSY